MPLLPFFFATFILLSAFASAQEWASYGTISAEPTAGRICAGHSNGKDIVCASPAPYVDASGQVGIGTAAPVQLLDVRAGTGAQTNARFGDTQPLFLVSNSPNIAFNMYYDAAATTWRYGDTGYAGTIGYNVATGDMNFYSMAASGTPDAALTLDSARMTIKRSGSVGIGTVSAAASALLDLTSTTKGFLPPRMTTAQRDAISAPAAGLTLYNTSTGTLNLYTGSAWTALVSGAAGSSGQIQFNSGGGLGADSNLFWDDTNKRLGIGTASPARTLDIGLGSTFYVQLRDNDSAGVVLIGDGTQLAGAMLPIFYAKPVSAARYSMFLSEIDANDDSGTVPAIVLNARKGPSTDLTSRPLLSIRGNSTDHLTVLASGNVGVGTTSPGAKLEVAGTLKVADSADTCTTAADRGKFRFNPVTGKFQICK